MQIRVLGPVDVVDEDADLGRGDKSQTRVKSIAIGGPIPHRLLAMLVAGGPTGVDVESLVEQLWNPATPPMDPVASIRTYVARLRTTLGSDSIETGSRRYHLNQSVLTADIDQFESLVDRARRASGSPSAAELWRQALDLWRGPAFGDQADLESIRLEANRLDELRAEATEAWFDARLAGGAGREMVADVEAAVAEFPLREGFRVQQMTVLGRVGRQPDALRAFQEFRSDLTEIGLEPSERLAELDREIAAGNVPNSGARQTLRGYEIGERLGEGAFAVVFEATQTSVDRTVAVKQIRSSLADSPEFIRQFEAEAHMIARLEHPHIVPLYDYWREPGSAYLIMRYLEGGSLHSRILEGNLDLVELVPLIGQVAAGLEVAHNAGVIHRDVKPANILLDNTGNAYLSDFGIAVEEAAKLDPEAWLSHGSPAYSPPEQMERKEIGPRADVYALGVTVYEALTGALPFPTETTMAGLLDRQLHDPIPLVRSSLPALPAAVDSVLQKATAKSPDHRYSSAVEFATELALAAELEGDSELIEPTDRNPYKGLQAFDEADAGDFAGRDRLVNKLVTSVAKHRVTAVVGPSGSGKSSVVRAGLLPAIRQDRIRGSASWFVTTMIPGSDPFADLADAILRVAVDPPPDLAAELRSGSKALARIIRRLVPKDRELVLLVDQFEELFTLSSEKDRKRFLDALVEAAADEESRLRVVLTIRADFYDHPLRHPAFARLIEDATVAVHPLAADELERAITEPARAVGATFESGLVAEISADVADQPGALPMLQYALTELYDRRQISGHPSERSPAVLSREAYRELGGVSGAIARRAEEQYSELSAADQEFARQTFPRMVSLGDGTEDTRRRVLRSELGADALVGPMLDRFGAIRLLAFDRDPATREPTVEVGHEALIREWPRLRAWLDDDRDGQRILRHLTETAGGWSAGGRQESELYRGGRLEAAATWGRGRQNELNDIESDFLVASVARQEAEDAAERRVTQRLRRLLAGAAVIAALALIAGGLAFQQRGQAKDQANRAEEQTLLADEQAVLATENAAQASENADLATANGATAETRRLIADAANLTEENLDIALLLAAEAYNRDPSPSSLAGLQRVMTETGNYLGVLGRENSYEAVHWTGDRIVAVSASVVDVFDARTALLERRIDLPRSELGRPLTLADGRTVSRLEDSILVIESGGSGFILIDVESGELQEISHDVQVTTVAVDAERGLVLVGDADEYVSLYRSANGQSVDIDSTSFEQAWRVLAFPETRFADISYPDGYKLSDNSIGSQVLIGIYEPYLFGRGVRGVSFGPGGHAYASGGGHLRQYMVESGELAAQATPIILHPSLGQIPALFAELSFVEDWLIASTETTTSFLNKDLELIANLRPDRGRVDTQVVMQGAAPVSAATPSVVGILNNGRLLQFEEHDGDVQTTLTATWAKNPTGLALSPTKDVVAISGANGITLVALAGQQLLADAAPGHGHVGTSISPDGLRTLAGSIGIGNPAAVNFLESGDVLALDSKHGAVAGSVEALSFDNVFFVSNDFALGSGREFGEGSSSNFLLDGHTFEVLGPLPQFDFGEGVSPDGSLLVIGLGLALNFIDVDTFEILERLDVTEWADPTVDILVRKTDFSIDGSLLYAAFGSGRMIVIDVETRTVVKLFEPNADGTGGIATVTLSPDGKLLATRDLTGSIDIRDPETLEIHYSLQGGTTSFETFTNGPYFSPDSRYLLTTREASPRLWDLVTRTDLGTFPVGEGLGVEGSTGENGLNLVTRVDEWTMIWNLNTDEWFDIACQAAGRNLTQAEWDQFGPADAEYHATCPQWS